MRNNLIKLLFIFLGIIGNHLAFGRWDSVCFEVETAKPECFLDAASKHRIAIDSLTPETTYRVYFPFFTDSFIDEVRDRPELGGVNYPFVPEERTKRRDIDQFIGFEISDYENFYRNKLEEFFKHCGFTIISSSTEKAEDMIYANGFMTSTVFATKCEKPVTVQHLLNMGFRSRVHDVAVLRTLLSSGEIEEQLFPLREEVVTARYRLPKRELPLIPPGSSITFDWFREMSVEFLRRFGIQPTLQP